LSNSNKKASFVITLSILLILDYKEPNPK